MYSEHEIIIVEAFLARYVDSDDSVAVDEDALNDVVNVKPRTLRVALGKLQQDLDPGVSDESHAKSLSSFAQILPRLFTMRIAFSLLLTFFNASARVICSDACRSLIPPTSAR
jgi:hypothetical protein